LPKNERGFLEINEFLQVSSYKDVFAVGDCATLYNNEQFIAPTADVAEQMGDLCSENIMRLILKKEMKKHNIRSRGILIALGQGYAVGKIFKFYISGYIAFLIKKFIEKLI